VKTNNSEVTLPLNQTMGRTNLDIDVLRSLASGVELGSFAQASVRVGRSQSAVSAQLSKLEH
jgi:hypothetical protein